MTHHAGHHEQHEPSALKGALSGAIAGAVGGFFMEKAQTLVMPKVQEAVKSARENVQQVTQPERRERAAARPYARDGGTPERPPRELEHARADAELTYDRGGRHQVVEASRGPQAESEVSRGGGGATRERQEQQQGGEQEESEPATVKAAEAVSETLFRKELEGKKEKQTAGRAAHYGMAITSGTIYGLAAEYDDRATFGYGTAFGTAVWAVADEAIVPALGLSEPPTEHPPSTHAYALASHLVYGVTTELVRRNVRKWMG